MKILDLKYNKWMLVLLTVLTSFSVACSDDEVSQKDTLSDKAEITSFKIETIDKVFVGEKRDNNKYVFKISPGDKEDDLKNLSPTFFISHGAVVNPLSSTPQDFYNEVKYTVTAENGAQQVWSISWEIGNLLEDGEGFDSYSRVWEKSLANMGLTDITTSIALCGEYLVASTGEVLDKKNAGSTALRLNMTGITGSLDRIVNDSKGNLIAAANPAENGNVLKLYKWSSVETAPTEILATAGISEILNLGVVGDINANAYITSEAPSADGKHYRWKVASGVANPVNDFIVSGIPSNDGNWKQNISLVKAEDNSPYFLSDAIGGGSNFHYVDGSATAIPGALLGEASQGPAGWGNYTGSYTYCFTFNGKVYGANFHSTWGGNFLTVVPSDDLTNAKFTETLPIDIYSTVYSMTSELSEDGYSLNLYAYTPAKGLYLFVLNRY